MQGKTSIDVEVHPQLTITEETAETCLWLLTKYLNANPDKTIKVDLVLGVDGYEKKVMIVPEEDKKGHDVEDKSRGDKISEVIKDLGYIKSCLLALKNIHGVGKDCSTCIKRSCRFRPELGAMVRLNCAHWVGEDLWQA